MGLGRMVRWVVLLFSCLIAWLRNERDVALWTSLIGGFGRNGWFGEGLRVRKMANDGFLRPNEATYVSVLAHTTIVCFFFAPQTSVGATLTAFVDLYWKASCLRCALCGREKEAGPDCGNDREKKATKVIAGQLLNPITIEHFILRLPYHLKWCWWLWFASEICSAA